VLWKTRHTTAHL
jgi:seryl-tRNA synthetase